MKLITSAAFLLRYAPCYPRLPESGPWCPSHNKPWHLKFPGGSSNNPVEILVFQEAGELRCQAGHCCNSQWRDFDCHQLPPMQGRLRRAKTCTESVLHHSSKQHTQLPQERQAPLQVCFFYFFLCYSTFIPVASKISVHSIASKSLW